MRSRICRSSPRPGVAHFELEHEPVHLRFGQGIGAFLLDGVLGGHDEEGIGQEVGFAAQGDLVFLHGFEQGALDLGRGAVDFVGQNDVGEDGTALDGERVVRRVVDRGAGKVGGKQIRGELESGEAAADGLGQGFHRQGFG